MARNVPSVILGGLFTWNFVVWLHTYMYVRAYINFRVPDFVYILLSCSMHRPYSIVLPSNLTTRQTMYMYFCVHPCNLVIEYATCSLSFAQTALISMTCVIHFAAMQHLEISLQFAKDRVCFGMILLIILMADVSCVDVCTHVIVTLVTVPNNCWRCKRTDHDGCWQSSAGQECSDHTCESSRTPCL